MGSGHVAGIGLLLLVAAPLVQPAQAGDADVSVAPLGAVDASDSSLRDRVHRAEDLSRSIPTLEIHSSFLTDPNLYIRGIGQQHFYDNFTAPVAVYSDGVYANRSAGQLLEAFDLAGAEVLRGPQGSLYGRNATAGAVLLTSQRPDGEFSGRATLRYGDYDLFELDGAVGFPVLGERLSARIAGTAHFRDGITENRCRNTEPYDAFSNPEPECDLNGFNFANTGKMNRFPVAALGDFESLKKWQNDVEDWAGRGLLRFQPTHGQDWLLKFHAERNRGDSRHLQMAGTGSRGLNSIAFSEDSKPRFDTDPFVGWYDQDGDDRLDRWGASLVGAIDLGEARLTSISGYWRREHRVQDEGDAMPWVSLATDWSDETWQVSQELRVDGAGEDHAWSLGAELLYEDAETENLFKDLNFNPVRQRFDQTLLSFAPYFHALWAFGPYWSAELGARFTWEQRDAALETAVESWERFELAPGIFAAGWDGCCVASGVLLAFPELRDAGSWGAPTGELKLHFTPVDDVRFYAQYTRGRKGAQFYAESFENFFVPTQAIHTAKPEFVHALEGGLRSTWLDGALSFDAAAFWADYQDMQVFHMANEVGRPPVRQLLNADARVLGVEAEFAFRPLPRLYAQLGFGWLDAEYTSFSVVRQVNPPFARGGAKATHDSFDYSGNPLVGAPRYRLSGRVDYTLALGRWGALLPSFAFRYRSKTHLDPQKKVELAQPAYWVLDARLAYRTPDQRIEVAGWVRNLTDEHYLTDAFDQSIDLNQILYVYADPRLFGASLSYVW